MALWQFRDGGKRISTSAGGNGAGEDIVARKAGKCENLGKQSVFISV